MYKKVFAPYRNQPEERKTPRVLYRTLAKMYKVAGVLRSTFGVEGFTPASLYKEVRVVYKTPAFFSDSSTLNHSEAACGGTTSTLRGALRATVEATLPPFRCQALSQQPGMNLRTTWVGIPTQVNSGVFHAH